MSPPTFRQASIRTSLRLSRAMADQAPCTPRTQPMVDGAAASDPSPRTPSEPRPSCASRAGATLPCRRPRTLPSPPSRPSVARRRSAAPVRVQPSDAIRPVRPIRPIRPCSSSSLGNRSYGRHRSSRGTTNHHLAPSVAGRSRMGIPSRPPRRAIFVSPLETVTPCPVHRVECAKRATARWLPRWRASMEGRRRCLHL